MGVCVLGGGTAGSEAALEASVRGAEVTVVEKSERPDPPCRSWPDLIRVLPHTGEADRPTRSLDGSPADRVIVAEALSAEKGSVATSAGDLHPDFAVLATGSSFELPAFQGHRKPGVFLLDSLRSYEELGRRAPSLSRVVVAGEGGRGLEVAERLSGQGRRVKVFVSGWQSERPSPLVLDVLSEAASEAGVSVCNGSVAKALGAGRVEAALVGGSVVPCDALVFVPRRVPRMVATQAQRGPLGGAVVDRSLRTSVPSIFAAGGCAEPRGASPPYSLEGEPSLSGRMAGSNCLGDGLSLSPTRSRQSTVFSLVWSRVGLAPSSPSARTTRSATAGRRWGRYSACEVVFEGPTQRVISIESVERLGKTGMGRLPLQSEMTLRSLAYGGLGSSDISLVSETARLGLAEWRRY